MNSSASFGTNMEAGVSRVSHTCTLENSPSPDEAEHSVRTRPRPSVPSGGGHSSMESCMANASCAFL